MRLDWVRYLRWLPSAEVIAPLALPAAGATGSVLVVDDNADMRDYIARLLRDDGWWVDAAADGQAALDALVAAAERAASKPGANGYDLVLSDVMMPRLDGFGLVAALRANELTRQVPVILLSARAGEDSRVDGMNSGAE